MSFKMMESEKCPRCQRELVLSSGSVTDVDSKVLLFVLLCIFCFLSWGFDVFLGRPVRLPLTTFTHVVCTWSRSLAFLDIFTWGKGWVTGGLGVSKMHSFCVHRLYHSLIAPVDPPLIRPFCGSIVLVAKTFNSQLIMGYLLLLQAWPNTCVNIVYRHKCPCILMGEESIELK